MARPLTFCPQNGFILCPNEVNVKKKTAEGREKDCRAILAAGIKLAYLMRRRNRKVWMMTVREVYIRAEVTEAVFYGRYPDKGLFLKALYAELLVRASRAIKRAPHREPWWQPIVEEATSS